MAIHLHNTQFVDIIWHNKNTASRRRW